MTSRCLHSILVVAVALVSLALPTTSAQGSLVPGFTVTVTAIDADVLPGEIAEFNVTIGNPAQILDREARMNHSLPVGWTATYSVDPVAVAHESSNSTIWRISVPSGTAPGTYPAMVEAADQWNFTRVNVTITVREPPVAPPPAAPAAPDITLTPSTGDSAPSGETASGLLTITSGDARTLALTISVTPNGGWIPAVPAADQNRVLAPGATTTARLVVPIPELASEATNAFTVSVRAATTDGAVSRTFTTTWSVVGTPRPAPSDEGEPTTDPTTPVAATPTPTRTPVVALTSNLDVYVAPLELEIPVGGVENAVVQLRNTGNVRLLVTLASQPPASWELFTFVPSSVIELGPGDSADVPMRVVAPDNVPPGGQATAKVVAVADNDLVRSASFVLRLVPGAPRDTTETATTEAPATPDGGFPVQAPSLLIVATIAAVGSAAAVVASRPLREKMLWVGAGLYTRLARPDVLGHEDREKLYRLVETTPGIHFHALQRDLGWNTGTLTYHLRVLERHGFVVSRRDGLYRRFYLSGAAPRKEVFENQGPTGLRADVLEAVRNTPGISQSDLALGLGANKQTVNYHVKALERAGTIRVEKRGRDTFLYPGGGAAAGSDEPVRA